MTSGIFVTAEVVKFPCLRFTGLDRISPWSQTGIAVEQAKQLRLTTTQTCTPMIGTLSPGHHVGLSVERELRSRRLMPSPLHFPVGTATKIQRFALLVGGGVGVGLSSWHDWPLRPTELALCSPREDRWRRYGGPLLVVKINRMTWRKSGVSGSEGCVEVAAVRSSILVRDSKDPHGPVLTFSGPEWTRFLACMHKRRT